MSHHQEKAGHPHRYEGETFTVLYDKGRCIHAAECVRGLPAVFNPQERPWVKVDAATREEVLAVVWKCPSGALFAEGQDGERLEAEPTENTVRVVAGGPLHLKGRLELVNPAGEVLLAATRLALCRCGASKNKPFCDNSHHHAGFDDPGPRAVLPLKHDPATVTGETLRVTVRPNASLGLEGSFTVTSSDGHLESPGTKTSLCRCGASANKPLCDGSHNRVGFVAG